MKTTTKVSSLNYKPKQRLKKKPAMSWGNSKVEKSIFAMENNNTPPSPNFSGIGQTNGIILLAISTSLLMFAWDATMKQLIMSPLCYHCRQLQPSSSIQKCTNSIEKYMRRIWRRLQKLGHLCIQWQTFMNHLFGLPIISTLTMIIFRRSRGSRRSAAGIGMRTKKDPILRISTEPSGLLKVKNRRNKKGILNLSLSL